MPLNFVQVDAFTHRPLYGNLERHQVGHIRPFLRRVSVLTGIDRCLNL
jgi:hypothetical protein